MRRIAAILVPLLLVFAGASAVSRGGVGAAGSRASTVTNDEGAVIETFDGTGRVTSVRPPLRTSPIPSHSPRLASYSVTASEAPGCSEADPSARITSAGDGRAFVECASPAENGIRILREFRNQNAATEVGGFVHVDDEETGLTAGTPLPVRAAHAGGTTLTNPVTIDRMTTAVSWGYTQTHDPGGALFSLGSADIYFLGDGSQWASGAGTHYQYQISLDHVEVSGDTIRYVLVNPGLIYQQTDYDSGDHSAQGSLAVEGTPVIETTAGSTVATLKGAARIVSNDSTYYGDRFNFYSAPVGSVVPFQVTYTLTDSTWGPSSFEQSFHYQARGWVDFAHPVSLPRILGISIGGSSQVPGGSSVQYRATARFEHDVLRDVTEAAAWSVEPASLASISQGLLTTQPITTGEESLRLHVEYEWDGAQVQADKTVILRQGGSANLPGAWPMYQGNASHTGYAPVSLEPDVFGLRWQRTIGSGYSLNPVTAADGKVFVSLTTYFSDVPSLFVLDARDGKALWSKNFGDVFSVNPPSYAYGNVYIQTGNHGDDTYLWAHDAATGDLVFRAPHAAQWERYFAPTIYEGGVYVNGGYYGGMYAFDAFSGEQRWFMALPQYDEWTPAVDANFAYAYVGDYNPGLYAANRVTGASAFMIPDPSFDWNGWSMDQAPVLGGRDDLLAIHDGRLISFDLPSRTIRYELNRGFQGQPSVAHDTIYAIDSGALVALEEETGSQIWSWSPPQGTLRGALIVTDSHVLATTGEATYAVELLSRTQVWSYPASGDLALGNETLYIASSSGVLTAISMPEYIASLTRLELVGPAEVVENSSIQYTARAHYSDGRVRDRTVLTEWSVQPATSAGFAAGGVLNVAEMLDLSQDVVVHARYTEGGTSVEADKSVRLVIGVTVEQFIERNLAGAVAIKRQVLELLGAALAREDAVVRAMGTGPNGEPLAGRTSDPRVDEVLRAMGWERLATWAVQRSIPELLRALLGEDPPAIRGPASAEEHGAE